MKNNILLITSTFLMVVLAACAGPPPEDITPTEIKVPTATATEKPTETPTELPPTEVPEPTEIPVYQELPYVWLMPLYDFLASNGLVKGEDFDYSIGACTNPEYSDFEECVLGQDFCLEVQGCNDVVLSLMYLSSEEVIWPVTDYLLENEEISRVLTFNEYFLMLVQSRALSDDLLLTENQALVWACLVGRPEDARWLPLSVWELSEQVKNVLFRKAHMPIWAPTDRGLDTCTRNVFGN